MPHLAAAGASSVLSQQILQNNIVQHRIGQKPLSTGVLRLQALQLAGVGNVQTAVLRLPLIECIRADPVLPANLRRLQAAILLGKDRDDLLFREP